MARQIDCVGSSSGGNKVSVAVIQMQSTSDKERNTRIATELIQDAATRKAKIIFLPDGIDFIPPEDISSQPNWQERILDSIAEPLDGPLLRTYKKLAEQHQVYLSLGGIHTKSKDGSSIYNSHIFINPIGRIVACYHKLHIPSTEHSHSSSPQLEANGMPNSTLHNHSSPTISPIHFCLGNKVIPPVESPGGLLGLADGHDLMFPEMSTCLREMGAQILTFPSNMPRFQANLRWELLLRSRALENECYVIAAAQCGPVNNSSSAYGHSIIISPSGDIISQCENERAAILFADIEINPVSKPTHRRRDIFSLVLGVGQPIDIGKQDYIFNNQIILNDVVFYRSLLSFAFINITQEYRISLFICPIEEQPTFEEMRQEQLSDLFISVQHILGLLKNYYTGYQMDIRLPVSETVHVQIIPQTCVLDIIAIDNPANNQASSFAKAKQQIFLHSLDDIMEEALTLRKMIYH